MSEEQLRSTEEPNINNTTSFKSDNDFYCVLCNRLKDNSEDDCECIFHNALKENELVF
jgi:hypothetical protein